MAKNDILYQIGIADLHMHTNHSDGDPSVDDVLQYVEKIGTLDAISITDHDTIEGSLYAHGKNGEYEFDIIPGMEVTSAQGHVLAWWIKEVVPCGLSLKETVGIIHDMGGVACLAHPFEFAITPKSSWLFKNNPQVVKDSGVDAIEIFNAAEVTPGANRLSKKLALELDIAQVGNSDAHTLEAIGRTTTIFEGRYSTGLRETLMNKKTLVSGRKYSRSTYFKMAFSMPKRMASFYTRS